MGNYVTVCRYFAFTSPSVYCFTQRLKTKRFLVLHPLFRATDREWITRERGRKAARGGSGACETIAAERVLCAKRGISARVVDFDKFHAGLLARRLRTKHLPPSRCDQRGGSRLEARGSLLGSGPPLRRGTSSRAPPWGGRRGSELWGKTEKL